MTNAARPSGRWRVGVLSSLLLAAMFEGPRPTYALPHPERPIAPLPEGDGDRDGLRDDEEALLAARYAPLVLLDRRDENRPASVAWLLRQVSPVGLDKQTPTTDERPRDALPPLFEMPEWVRGGAPDRNDWATYVHVFLREDGGINVQYWFFYPYNDGPLLFDHDGDWEHLTVRLDAERRPLGAYLAQHAQDNPGPYRSWSRLRKVDDHPVVLSALGSHATYAEPEDAPWFDRVSECADALRCDDPAWATWETPLLDLGERARPLQHPEVFGYEGRWGKHQRVPGTSGPFGPVQHRGFCVDGLSACQLRAHNETSVAQRR